MGSDVGSLRDEAAQHVERGRLDKAIVCYVELERLEPMSPQWPKRAAETYRRLGDDKAAIAAFERAVDRFAQAGFLVQAIAMCKLILQLDASHGSAIARLAKLTNARPRTASRSPTPAPVPATPPPAPPRAATANEAPPVAAKPRAATQPGVPVEPEVARATPPPARQPIARAPTQPGAGKPIRPRQKPGWPVPPRPLPARPGSEAEPARAAPPVPPAAPPAARPVVAPPSPPAARADARRPVPPQRVLITPLPADRLSGVIPLPPVEPRAAPPPPPRPTPPRPPAVPPIPPPRPVTVAAKPAPSTDELDAATTLRPRLGAPLDTIDLATVMPRSRRLTNADGTLSGITIIPLDDIATDVEFEWPSEAEVIDASETQPIALEPVATPTPLADITPDARRALIATPLFARLPFEVLEPLVARMRFGQLDAGDLVFREGDPGTCLYVISEGEVIVESRDQELARLGPGSFFGEIALITELPRSASVRAASRVEMLVIDRDVIRAAMAEHPEIVDVLLQFVSERLVDGVTRTSELFAGFTDPDRRALAARFELVEVDAGTVLVVEGARADGLYVLLAGGVDVTRGGAPRAALASGDVFGEMSLIGGGGAIATVAAATRVLALRMPAATFQEVMMTHPQVLAHVSELADRRSRDEEAVVDLHFDLL